jgi:hypothetical protein
VPYCARMAKRESDIDKLYTEWRQAEAKFAALLAEFPDPPPAKVHKASALALAKARDKATHAADKYFKRTLK